MAYLLTTADNFADLLNEMELFLEGQGWTVAWNTGSQLGCNSGNCFAAIGIDGGTNPVAVTDTYPNPDVVYQDFRAYGSLGKNFVGHASHYWGLTGSPVTGAFSGERVLFNDLLGPFSEVHFFGDTSYFWAVIRTDADRWTHFGWGVFDNLGMTNPDCAFMSGMFWRWWDNDNGDNGTKVKACITRQNLWFDDDDGKRTGLVYVPDGVLDPAFGITDDVINKTGIMNLGQFGALGPRINGINDYSDATIINHWPWIKNKMVTGGMPLMSQPVFFGNGASDDTSLQTFLGNFPGVRLCDISTAPIATDIDYAGETWLAFPLKRRTAQSVLAYDGKASSYSLGLAFRKA